MRCPADVYKLSVRPYRGIGELAYPFHDRTALVTCCGKICIFRKKINLSTSLAGQTVGLKEVDERYLAGQLYGLRSRLHRFGGEDPATLKQRLRPQGASYISGTFCKRSLRTV